MKTARNFVVGIFLGLSMVPGSANEYQSIVHRNAFGLISPSPISSIAQPAPVGDIKLTGIVTLPKPKAFFIFLPPNSAQPQFLSLAEGESIEMVEVITISIEKTEVLLRNGPHEMIVRFDKPSSFDATEPGRPEPGFQQPTDPSVVSYSARHQGQAGWGIGQRRPEHSR